MACSVCCINAWTADEGVRFARMLPSWVFVVERSGDFVVVEKRTHTPHVFIQQTRRYICVYENSTFIGGTERVIYVFSSAIDWLQQQKTLDFLVEIIYKAVGCTATNLPSARYLTHLDPPSHFFLSQLLCLDN